MFSLFISIAGRRPLYHCLELNGKCPDSSHVDEAPLSMWMAFSGSSECSQKHEAAFRRRAWFYSINHMFDQHRTKFTSPLTGDFPSGAFNTYQPSENVFFFLDWICSLRLNHSSVSAQVEYIKASQTKIPSCMNCSTDTDYVYKIGCHLLTAFKMKVCFLVLTSKALMFDSPPTF